MACNGSDFGVGATIPVASRPSCGGGYSGLFDLSGNVWEWEDSCDGTSGASDRCRVRGGSFTDTSANLACGYGTDAYAVRNHTPAIYGFRCCAD
jgi:formylglycine-generating enzyme required for sulfatase activity